MRVTIKGQVTVPRKIRKKFGIHPGTEVEIVESQGGVVLKKAGGKRPVDGVYGILKGKTRWKSADALIERLRGRG